MLNQARFTHSHTSNPMFDLAPTRLCALLEAFPALRIGVVGDFFLDSYIECDPALDEKSLETGKTCYQVIGYRRQPGAAGNVAANLRALGVGAVEVVGYCGDDGEGCELRRAMRRLGLDLTGFLTTPSRLTPTYGKPCYVASKQRGRPVLEELERFDIKNRRPTPTNLQRTLIDQVRQRLSQWDGLVLIDQVAEANCGVLTTRVRRAIAAALGSQPKLVVLADSRTRIGLFKHAILKPNQREARAALGGQGRLSLKAAHHHARVLSNHTGRPVFLTLGSRGILVADGNAVEHVPAVDLTAPVDPVGTGDTCAAALSAALAAGASLTEAAAVACLAASITAQQVGTTGTASPIELSRRLHQLRRS